ncbi:asparagine synthase (glutamine-hydrolyzing) [Constrictibacter sp. MBR-5]|jgi:asparagine synthase (glutamine-hydrolysing)|uniref:asparagine synthetase B family protein n=1 Tax=Constrictibacter sp. MBR-5 TaxID=3156467 RepID=UPI0033971BD8
MARTLSAIPGKQMRSGPVRMVAGAVHDDADGSILSLQGRIDNAQDLRRSLADLHGPADDDAALVLHALRRWGPDAPARLRGSFAFAAWDARTEQLLLAGEALGQRTVFHARVQGMLLFATDLRSLLALPGMPRDLDEAYLAAFLSDVVPEPDATLYAAIRRVPAASILSFGRDDAVSVHQYWHPDWGRRIRHRRDETYVEEARALLDQAVRRQMYGPGPVVCQLSGGLDSAAVAATAARLCAPAVVHALTVAPPDGVPRREHTSAISDERPGAAAVASLYPNMAWQAVCSSTIHALDENPQRLFLSLGMPARNVMNLGWFAPSMDRARALGARAVLGGFFGNMTLSWDGRSGLAGMARSGRWARLWREASALARTEGRSTGTVLRRHALKPLLPPRAQRWLDDRRRQLPPESERFSAIHPDFARATRIGERRLEGGHDWLGDTVTMRRRWLSRIQTLPPVMGPMGEVFGVELRDPTADLDLLDYCFAVPDAQYLRNGTTRWLARRVLADRLPAAVLNETRRGIQCPEFMHRMTLQRDAIVEGVEALERSPLTARILDVARMKRLAADWPAHPAEAGAGEYGAVLYRGLHVGQFLRWLEGGNR